MSPAAACCFKSRSRGRPVDRGCVLPPFEAVPRPAPAMAPFRGTTLRWPGEIVSPLRASISRAVSSASRAAGPQPVLLSTSRATASAASRLCGVRPGRGRARSAATPPEAAELRQRLTCSARTPRRWPIAALLSPASDHSTARARSASARRRAAQPLQLGACRVVHHQRAPPTHRPSCSPALQQNLRLCAFISRAA